jgi:ubiquinone/menaquinone biosynthesis C-methylase UbiE
MPYNFSRFFSNLQDHQWYVAFLSPLLEKVKANSQVLDVGTGPGQLVGMIYDQRTNSVVGVDTSQSMLVEARRKLGKRSIELRQTVPGQPLPFASAQFDTIVFSNLLFNLSAEEQKLLLGEANRLLHPKGQILVLTPTGGGRITDLFKMSVQWKEWTIWLWYWATRGRARSWSVKQPFRSWATQHGYSYQRVEVLNGLAQMEIGERFFAN